MDNENWLDKLQERVGDNIKIEKIYLEKYFYIEFEYRGISSKIGCKSLISAPEEILKRKKCIDRQKLMLG